MGKNKILLISQKAVIIEQDKILLVKNCQEQLELPGGLLEMGERMAEGLKREIKEELGQSIEIKRLLAVADYLYNDFKINKGQSVAAQIVALAFDCQLKGKDKTPILSFEHGKYGWFDKKTLKRLNLGFLSNKLIKKMLKDKLI